MTRYRETYLWLRATGKQLLLWPWDDRRFVRLTPPSFRHQRLLDRVTLRVLNLLVGDKSELKTLGKIFVQEEYSLRRLPHWPFLEGQYRSILAGGGVPLIVDLGANCGLAARYFAETLPECHIIAVEPDTRTASRARCNTRSTSTQVIQAAVGCEPGEGSLTDPGHGSFAYRVTRHVGNHTGFRVPIMSMNQILEEYRKPNMVPFVAKIDIEGSEQDLFASSTEWIRMFPVVVIELHDWMLPGRGTSRNFLKAISQEDRDIVLYGENLFSVSNVARQPNDRSING